MSAIGLFSSHAIVSRRVKLGCGLRVLLRNLATVFEGSTTDSSPLCSFIQIVSPHFLLSLPEVPVTLILPPERCLCPGFSWWRCLCLLVFHLLWDVVSPWNSGWPGTHKRSASLCPWNPEIKGSCYHTQLDVCMLYTVCLLCCTSALLLLTLANSSSMHALLQQPQGSLDSVCHASGHLSSLFISMEVKDAKHL